MALTKHIYSIEDMVEQSIEKAPSLDLPDIAVERFYVPHNKGKYMLFFANVKKTVRPKDCPFCKESGCIVLAGRTPLRVIHDVIRNNRRVDFVIQPLRVQCKKCGQRFVPSIPSIDEKHSMTKRLLEYLRIECFLQPHTALAERSGVSVETIRRIIREETTAYDLFRRSNPPTAPRVLGIDEKHITNYMRGTIVDVEKGQLLDLLKDNKRNTMIIGLPYSNARLTERKK